MNIVVGGTISPLNGHVRPFDRAEAVASRSNGKTNCNGTTKPQVDIRRFMSTLPLFYRSVVSLSRQVAARMAEPSEEDVSTAVESDPVPTNVQVSCKLGEVRYYADGPFADRIERTWGSRERADVHLSPRNHGRKPLAKQHR